jgi:hypothetical protein
MTSDTRIRYRKMPGHRRGLINGSSVWLGPDHLLLVTSQRFKEEYKRFYFRDIQSIAVARTTRFHLSSRSAAIAFLWFLLFGASQTYPALTPVMWSVALVLILAWLYLSIDRSCVCRVYTAVSSYNLPSVYRTWTARRFLAQLEPRIREAQGEIDPAWLETDAHTAGPDLAPPTIQSAEPATSILDAPDPTTPVPEAPSRTLASDLFLAALLVEAALDAFAFGANPPAVTWTLAAVAVAQSVVAVLLFVDYHRGRLRSGLHAVAIAKLIWLTLLFYIDTGYSAVTRTTLIPIVPVNDLVRGIDLGISIALLAAGLTITMRRPSAASPDFLGS